MASIIKSAVNKAASVAKAVNTGINKAIGAGGTALKARIGENMGPSQTAAAYNTISKSAQPPIKASSSFGNTPANVPNNASYTTAPSSSAPTTLTKTGTNTSTKTGNSTQQSSPLTSGGVLGALSRSISSGLSGGGRGTASVANSINTPPDAGSNEPIASRKPTTYRGQAASQTDPQYFTTRPQVEDQSRDAVNTAAAATLVATKEDRERNNRILQEAALNRTNAQTQAKAAEETAAQSQQLAEQNPEDLALQEQARQDREIYEDFNRKAEELMVETPEEVEAQKQEDALNAQEAAIKAQLEKSQTEIGGQPIPYAFITGQQSAVANRANADLGLIAAQKIPITQQLARLQSKRQSALDVVKEGQQYARETVNRNNELLDEKRKRGYQLQDKASDRAAEKADKTYSLSEGQTVYDANGRVIVSKPKPPVVAKPVAKTGMSADVRNEMVADITQNGATLEQLYGAYPEATPTEIRTLFNSLKSSTSSRSVK